MNSNVLDDHVDADAIDREGEIPDKVLKNLQRLVRSQLKFQRNMVVVDYHKQIIHVQP